jgi:hypothetical protein
LITALLAIASSWVGCGDGGDSATAGSSTSQGGGDATCGPGTNLCGETCTVLDFDPDNCGACGTICAAGEVCSDGACGATCGTGTLQCNDVCVDPDVDPEHCGACNQACGPGEFCANGACAISCSAGGLQECSGLCVDTANDPQNCGACDIPCAANEVCSSGQCVSECGIGLATCDMQCADLMTDEDYCGDCTTACTPGQDCVMGVCIMCDSNITDCDGDGWLVSDGDCCDKSGACGLEPELVNPGAIEVVGNGIDDNCNNLTDLFDSEDTVPCDEALASSSSTGADYAAALGLCRSTQENPANLIDKTWGVIDAQLLRADGTPISDNTAHSIRQSFGSVSPAKLEGASVVVLSSGIAADATQTMPGPNGGAPAGGNVSTTHTGGSSTDLLGCADPKCIGDWFGTANPPLKNANELPVAPNCGSGNAGQPDNARDSAMLYLRVRAPTNAKAFSFNSYFMSAEYPEYVCSNFNDQFIALVDTPAGTPQPIANPIDKNLLVYNDGMQKWPIGINIANGTSLFSVCESQMDNPGCWDSDVSTASCFLGPGQLAGTGFEAQTACLIGGGTYWLTTAGNIIPGDIVELRIAVWDVGDTAYDSVAIVDGFNWLPNATVPGTD